MPDWKALLGGESDVRQLFLWGVAIELVHLVLQAPETELSQLLWEAYPSVALAPGDAADIAARGIDTPQAMAGEAAKAGVNADRFRLLMANVLQTLPADQLAAAERLGLLGDTGAGGGADVASGVQRSRLDPAWWPIVQQLSRAYPTPEAMLSAYLEGQVDEATARAEYAKLGGVPEYFDVLYNSQGSAPTPTEALTMANRGIIAWEGTGPDATTYEQAFLEGPWRNKWLKPFIALGAYLPPPRTVVAMLRDGSLDIPTATTLLEHQGLTAELAGAYVADATTQAVKDDKQATEGVVTSLYREGGITESEATSLLEALGYTTEAAGFILAAQDLQRGLAALNAAVGRIGTYYIARKLDDQGAATALRDLQLPADQITSLLRVWAIDRANNLKLLTESQVADAWSYGVLTQEQAQSELEALGYLPHDAWTVLSVKNKAPLPNEPPADQTTLPI